MNKLKSLLLFSNNCAYREKNPYVMSFGDSSEDDLSTSSDGKSYTVFKESPINTKFLGLQRVNNQNSWDRTRFVIPKFRGSKILKTYYISEYCLMSQLTYGKCSLLSFQSHACLTCLISSSDITPEWFRMEH